MAPGMRGAMGVSTGSALGSTDRRLHVHVGQLHGREGAGSEGRVMLGEGLRGPCVVRGWGLPRGTCGHRPPEAALIGTSQEEDGPDWSGEWFPEL